MPKTMLGGKEFDLSALTFDQLETLTDDLVSANPLTAPGVKAIRRLLAASIGAQVSAEDLGKLPVTLEELHLAWAALAETSGLRPLLTRLAVEAAASRSAGSN